MTTAYVCPNGCCSLQLGAAVVRGAEREVYLNGEKTTYTALAKRFGRTSVGIYHRIGSRHCLHESAAQLAARRVKRRVERQTSKPSNLVNQFLRALPAPVSRRA